MDIPAPQIPIDATELPAEVAELPQRVEAPESVPLLISFADYKTKECGIQAIEGKRARKALYAIREVGMKLSSQEDFQNHKDLSKLTVKPVHDSGSYRDFYRGLRDSRPDIEIQEILIDADKGRLFFFIASNTFNIVAITDSHKETDKQRR